MTFAGQDQDGDLRLGRNDYDAWPGTPLVVSPDNHSIVIDHGMLDFVLQYCVSYLGTTTLVEEFS